MSELECRDSGRPLNFRTRDVAAAREHASKTFVEHDVQLSGTRGFDFRLALAPSPRLTLSRIRYGTEVMLTTPPMRDCYDINMPIAGESTAEQNGVRATTVGVRAGVALAPGEPLRVRWSGDAQQYVIKIPSAVLDEHAAKLAGLRHSEPVRLDLSFDLTGARGRALLATAGFMYTELTKPGGLATVPSACHDLEAAFLTQLLAAAPNQLTPLLHGTPKPVRHSKIRDIMDFVDRNPTAATGTADLAAITGLSARALQIGFRSVAGASPSAYIRGVRLERVHRDLRSGVAGTVTEAAARWGFFHLSRLSAQYSERFGELPSETARHPRP